MCAGLEGTGTLMTVKVLLFRAVLDSISHTVTQASMK